ncbi:MAG TPA: HIT family protein [Phycisphaerae bacterium]|jgi:histidine triad (HIT) family protein|nr:HIT family protein [Phycisphaerae bacterium]
MADCIFCKIAAGEIPCTKVYEDDLCLAFMDIGPISPGHTLLIPKRHYETIMEMPPDEVAHLAARIPALAAAVKDTAQAEGINVLQNNGRCSGQAVLHVHIHFIPRWPEDGLGFRWPAKEADPATLEEQAEAVRRNLT